jgi:hypothetical protein
MILPFNLWATDDLYFIVSSVDVFRRLLVDDLQGFIGKATIQWFYLLLFHREYNALVRQIPPP